MKLALLNIGLCRPGDISKSIHGMPGRFTFCFGELEEASPWVPLHVELGFRPDDSTVSVVGGQGTQSMWCGFTTPEGIVHMVADGMRYYGNNGYLRGTGAPLLVIGPGHANIFHAAGWDKRRIKEELFARTALPLSQVPPERQISRPVYESWDRGRSINVCEGPGNIVVVVAGGAEPYHLTHVPSFTHPVAVITKRIRQPAP